MGGALHVKSVIQSEKNSLFDFNSICFHAFLCCCYSRSELCFPPIVRYDYNPGKYSGNGPYSYSTYQLPGWSHGATVYYPTNASAPFSGIVFCPPYTGTQIMFRDWGPFFASHGIVLVTMDTSSILISVDERAVEQRTVLNLLKAENSRSGSPLYQKLDTDRVGAMGWSMGGGATWINSAEYPGLKTAMSLAGHNLTAININSKGFGTQCPTIIFCGALDTTILGGLGQSEGVYYIYLAVFPRFITKLELPATLSGAAQPIRTTMWQSWPGIPEDLPGW